MRALAILSVLLAHGIGDFGTFQDLPRWQQLIQSAVGRAGPAGVRIFFAISGYLICTRLIDELSRHSIFAALRAFYIRRAFRIIPPLAPYLLVLCVGAAFKLLPVTSAEILAAGAFGSNYFNPKSWYTSHFWSLAFEEHFYLFWPILLAFGGPRLSKILAVTVIIITAIARPLAVAGLSGDLLSHTLQKTHFQLDSFMLPCLTTLLLANSKWKDRLFRFARYHYLGGLVALLIIASAYSQQVSFPGLDLRSVQTVCLTLLVILPTIAPQLRITKMLESKWLVWIGQRSYSIYIWQQIFLVPMHAPFGQKVGWFLVKSGVIVCIAAISYRFIETPLMGKGRSIASTENRK